MEDTPDVRALLRERKELQDEIRRLRGLIRLGDFSGLRPNSDSFKLMQRIRCEQPNDT